MGRVVAGGGQEQKKQEDQVGGYDSVLSGHRQEE